MLGVLDFTGIISGPQLTCRDVSLASAEWKPSNKSQRFRWVGSDPFEWSHWRHWRHRLAGLRGLRSLLCPGNAKPFPQAFLRSRCQEKYKQPSFFQGSYLVVLYFTSTRFTRCHYPMIESMQFIQECSWKETHCLNKIRKIQISPSGLASKHPIAGTRCPARMCCLRWTFAGGVDIDFDYIFWLGCHHLSTLQYIAHHNHIKQNQAISKMPRQKRFKSANLKSFKRFKHFKTRLEVQKKPPL